MFRKSSIVILLVGVAFALSAVEGEACFRRSRCRCIAPPVCVGESTSDSSSTESGVTSAADEKMLKEVADFLEYEGKDLEELKEAWKSMDADAKRKLHDKTKTPPDGDQSSSAEMIVSLPADAVLTINDEKTNSTSGLRTFLSPALAAGTYSYTLVAEIVRDGATLRMSQSVEVRPGQVTRVDLRFPDNPSSVTRR